MNEKETRQHVRDIATAKDAVEDYGKREYHSPIGFMNPFPRDEKIHDQKVYDAAYKEAREQEKKRH